MIVVSSLYAGQGNVDRTANSLACTIFCLVTASRGCWLASSEGERSGSQAFSRYSSRDVATNPLSSALHSVRVLTVSGQTRHSSRRRTTGQNANDKCTKLRLPMR